MTLFDILMQDEHICWMVGYVVLGSITILGWEVSFHFLLVRDALFKTFYNVWNKTEDDIPQKLNLWPVNVRLLVQTSHYIYFYLSSICLIYYVLFFVCHMWNYISHKPNAGEFTNTENSSAVLSGSCRGQRREIHLC